MPVYKYPGLGTLRFVPEASRTLRKTQKTCSCIDLCYDGDSDNS